MFGMGKLETDIYINKTNMKAVNSSSDRPKLFNNKFLHYFTKLNPFRGELVEVEMKVVGKRIVYTYTKVRTTNA